MVMEVFSKAVSSKEFYIDARDIIQQIELTNVEQGTIDLLGIFFNKYSRLPTREELLLFLPELPEREQKYTADYRKFINAVYAAGDQQIDSKVLIDQLKESAAKRRIRQEVVEIADSFDKSASTDIIKRLEHLIYTQEDSRDRRIEVDVSNIEKNLPMIKYMPAERISTMMRSFDKMLYGGPGIRELMTIVAPSSRGKTAFLINLFYGFLMQRLDTVYVSLEMSVIDILRRLYRRILYKDKNFLTEGNDEAMRTWLHKFFGSHGVNGRVLFFPANTFSSEDLKIELLKLEMKEGIIPRVIIIDHLDLMVSRTKSVRQKESYAYWRLLTDDLREIPLMRGIPIITATQATKQSSTKTLVTEQDVGESYGKVQSSDVVVSLNQTSAEWENKRMRLAVIKNRDFHKNMEVEMYSDMDTMTICDLKFAQLNGWL